MILIFAAKWNRWYSVCVQAKDFLDCFESVRYGLWLARSLSGRARLENGDGRAEDHKHGAATDRSGEELQGRLVGPWVSE